MCGVVGVYSREPVERARLQRALAALQRRGPDDKGAWWSDDGRVGIGHRRLAIRDVENGRQPIETVKTVTAVNGEFYGLPKDYEARSDSLALSRYYERHGLDRCLARLRGEFAFLLYDRQRNRLVAARDRFGVKPLLWARLGPELWFASKASALWAAGIAAGWCTDSFTHAATTQYAPVGGTLFEGVHSLEPGQVLTVDSNGTSEKTYWRIPSLDPRASGAENFGEVFHECVQQRVRKGEKTAVLLSGGVDSAAVLATAVRSGEQIKAYTIDFPHSKDYSEGRLAALQARHCGVSHQLISLSHQTLLQGLRPAVRDAEGLCVNGHLVGKWTLSKAVREDDCKVLLSGEGADELLFGYRHFRPYFKHKPSLEDPAGLGILISRCGLSPLGELVPYFFHAKYHLGQKILRFLDLPNEPERRFGDLRRGVRLEGGEGARECWSRSALSDYILQTLGDGSEMSHSVEGRPPFLDHILWEYCAGRGSEACTSDKMMLRKSMTGLVVEEVRTKPKHPFMAPAMGQPLRDLLRLQIGDSEHPYVDQETALETLGGIEDLVPEQQLEWEPALLWLLSSYYLQELWKGS